MCGICYDKGKYVVQSDDLYEIVTCECQVPIGEDHHAN